MTVTAAAAASPAVPFAGFGDEAALDLDLGSPRVAAQVMARLLSPDFEDWSNAAARVGSCANPIRLTGSSMRVDATTGEVLSSYSADAEPLGMTLHPVRQPARGRVPVLLAGLRGRHVPPDPRRGRRRQGRPGAVGENPLVFATLTAPVVRARPRAAAQRSPLPAPRDRPRRCEHGRPAACHQRTTTATSCWASRCAGTATTTPPTSCGSGGRRSCGAGSPSRCAALVATTPRGHRVAGCKDVATRAVRQGRRVPAPRGGPLPRPDPPRRPQDRRRRSPPAPAGVTAGCWPTSSRPPSPSVAVHRPPVFAGDRAAAAARSAPSSTPARSRVGRRTDDPDRSR